MTVGRNESDVFSSFSTEKRKSHSLLMGGGGDKHRSCKNGGVSSKRILLYERLEFLIT